MVVAFTCRDPTFRRQDDAKPGDPAPEQAAPPWPAQKPLVLAASKYNSNGSCKPSNKRSKTKSGIFKNVSSVRHVTCNQPTIPHLPVQATPTKAAFQWSLSTHAHTVTTAAVAELGTGWVTVKRPLFWANSPEAWSAQVEAQVHLQTFLFLRLIRAFACNV